MSSLALMEWNTKPPSQWEWENLISFGAKSSENPKTLQPIDWKIDGFGGTESGSFYSPGNGAGGSGVSGSDVGYTSSTKSSKSVSAGSPSIGDMRTPKHPFESVERIPEDFCTTKEFAKVEQTLTSSAVETSIASGDPLLSLMLGKQTYSEDASGRSDAKSPSFSVIPVPLLTPAKRSKSNCLNTNPPRCQVEGCNLDLSSAKDYHRKHRVCENHSKSPKVIVAGLERRFCQQCSRFHSLSEFDEKKRSCRKRLSDHNARRRKPHPESLHINTASLSSAFSGGRNKISLVWNKVPLFNSKPSGNLMWSSRFMQTEGYPVKHIKTESSDRQVNMSCDGLPNTSAALSSDSDGIFPLKSTTTEVLNQGLSTQDFHRALSLLSSGSGGSCEPKTVTLNHTTCENMSSMHQPASGHTITPSLPVAMPEYWQGRPNESQAPFLDSNNYCNGHFQEFPRSSAPCGDESAFYSCQFD